MNLYCFKPCNWNYCGGMVLIAANDWAECLTVWQNQKEGEEFEADIPLRAINDGYVCWLLVAMYKIYDPGMKPSIQFIEYNEA